MILVARQLCSLISELRLPLYDLWSIRLYEHIYTYIDKQDEHVQREGERERDRERKRESDRERERDIEIDLLHMCFCVDTSLQSPVGDGLQQKG